MDWKVASVCVHQARCARKTPHYKVLQNIKGILSLPFQVCHKRGLSPSNTSQWAAPSIVSAPCDSNFDILCTPPLHCWAVFRDCTSAHFLASGFYTVPSLLPYTLDCFV
jgi:hypothetical protein